MQEGAGVDLYTTDRAAQLALLNEYEQFICRQIADQNGTGCSDRATIVQACSYTAIGRSVGLDLTIPISGTTRRTFS